MLRSETRPGSTLLLVIIISSVLMFSAVILLKIVYNTHTAANALGQGQQAFWLAEAGLEKGRGEIKRNLAWYTDLPHYPEDDVEWLKFGAVGQRINLGEGWFKIVCERDKNQLYSIGFKGKAVVILKKGESLWQII